MLALQPHIHYSAPISRSDSEEETVPSCAVRKRLKILHLVPQMQQVGMNPDSHIQTVVSIKKVMAVTLHGGRAVRKRI